MPDNELRDKEFEIGNKKIGPESTIRFSFKTLFWVLGVLYAILTIGYFDLRNDLKNSTIITQEEKEEFMHDVEEEYEDKFEEILKEVWDIKGNVKVILDRTSRNDINEITDPSSEVEITPIKPPFGNATDDSIE